MCNKYFDIVTLQEDIMKVQEKEEDMLETNVDPKIFFGDVQREMCSLKIL